MNFRTSCRFSAGAFTLLELFTVIAIVAILIVLLLPAIESNRESPNHSRARTDAMNIVTAVKAYNTEYGAYPNVRPSPARPAAGDTLVGDMVVGRNLFPPPVADNGALFDILRNLSNATTNKDFAGNPRHIIFFEGKSVSDPSHPRSGFLDNPKPADLDRKGSFYDQWGTQYFVIFDTNLDNEIDVSKIYTDFPASKLPKTGVGVFSFGKDRALGSPGTGILHQYKSGGKTSDDVISWQ